MNNSNLNHNLIPKFEPPKSPDILSIPTEYIGDILSTNSDYLKVLLYLIQNQDKRMEVSTILENLNPYVADANAALVYWKEKGILRFSEPLSEDTNADNNNISTMKTEQEILFAFGIKDRDAGRSEREYIEKWTSAYGFKLEMIVEACKRTLKSTGGATFPYADKVLSYWKEIHIESLDDLKKLDELREKKKQERECKPVSKPPTREELIVMDTFQITTRLLTIEERNYVNIWFHEYGFSEDMVVEACTRTLKSINKVAFKYTNSILTSWYNKNLRTIEAVQENERQYRENRKKNS